MEDRQGRRLLEECPQGQPQGPIRQQVVGDHLPTWDHPIKCMAVGRRGHQANLVGLRVHHSKCPLTAIHQITDTTVGPEAVATKATPATVGLVYLPIICHPDILVATPDMAANNGLPKANNNKV